MVKSKKDNVESPITSKAAASRHLHPAADKFKCERDYFRMIRDDLAEDPKFKDKFVAILDNEIVDSSSERLELKLKMSKKYPQGGFYIGKVYPH